MVAINYAKDIRVGEQPTKAVALGSYFVWPPLPDRMFLRGQSLVYDFTNQRYGTRLPDDTITYTTDVNELDILTRASTATYWGPSGTLLEAAIDEARIQHDPVTGEALGLLVESSETNVVLNSQGPPGEWATTGGSLTLTEGGAILGLPSVRASDGGANYARMEPQVSFPASPDEGLSVSFLIRLLTPELSYGHRLLWFPTSEAGWFWTADYDNGVLQPSSNSSGPDITGSIELIGDDTYLIRLVLPSESLPEQVSGNIAVYPGRTGSITEVTAVQVEDASSSPSSYIPTYDSPVTRAADNAVIDLSDVLNPDEGTFFFEFKAYVGGVPHQYVNFNNTFRLFETGTPGQIQLNWGVGSGVNARTGVSPGYHSFKLAFAYTGQQAQLAILFDGEVSARSTGVNFQIDNTLYMLNRPQGDRSTDGIFKTVEYYPEAVSEEQLIQMVGGGS